MRTDVQDSIHIGSTAQEVGICGMCSIEYPLAQLHVLGNKSGRRSLLCEVCRQKVNEELAAQTKDINLAGALLGGLIGAVLGSILWYFFTIWTEHEIGYISIGLGYLVGWGVHLGAGKKYGQRLQFLSAGFALLAIFITEKFIYEFFVNQMVQREVLTNPDFAAVYDGHYISIPFFDIDFLQSLVSPTGLLIYGIGIYFAFVFCRVRKV